GLSRFSFSAKKSSLVASAQPPSSSAARSIRPRNAASKDGVAISADLACPAPRPGTRQLADFHRSVPRCAKLTAILQAVDQLPRTDLANGGQRGCSTL